MVENTAPKSDLITRMFKAGTHFAYSRSRRHPTISSFIFGAKQRQEIFDLEKTSELLQNAREYVAQLAREGKTILFVGSKSEAVDAVRRGAEALGMPYQVTRWSGGILTNFGEINRRVTRLEELRSQRETGELDRKYTKKERLLIAREIERLERRFAGLVSMKQLPDALVVVDVRYEEIAVTEANKKNIPVIGLANSDCSIGAITYPIVGNDATISSITFVIEELVAAYKEGLRSKPVAQEAPAAAV